MESKVGQTSNHCRVVLLMSGCISRPVTVKCKLIRHLVVPTMNRLSEGRWDSARDFYPSGGHKRHKLSKSLSVGRSSRGSTLRSLEQEKYQHHF